MTKYFKKFEESAEIYEFLRCLRNGKAEYQKWSSVSTTIGTVYIQDGVRRFFVSEMHEVEPELKCTFQK